MIANISPIWFYVNVNCDYTGLRWHNFFRLAFFSTKLFQRFFVCSFYFQMSAMANRLYALLYSCSKCFLIRSLISKLAALRSQVNSETSLYQCTHTILWHPIWLPVFPIEHRCFIYFGAVRSVYSMRSSRGLHISSERIMMCIKQQ